MRNLFLLMSTLIASSLVFGQHANHIEQHKCSHHVADPQLSFERFDRPAWYDDYNVTFFHLDIAVENNSTFVSGDVTTHSVVLRETLDTLKFELIDQMIVESVTVNGISESFNHEDDVVSVVLSTPMSSGDELSYTVSYEGQPPSGGFFSGISTAYIGSWDKNVTWTLSEPFNAKQWWPCKQDLYDKADSVYVFITTSEENLAGSNGLLTAVTPMPDNKLRFEWKSNYPIAFYLVSLSVAEYQEYNIYAKPDGLENDSILIQNFIYDSPGCLEYYQEGINNTSEFIEVLSEKYGMYPFKDEKYGHCLSGIGGGMEHQTMSTMGGFGFSLVAHELGHMWFGDNVTCATWSDIWINEGFASYTEYLTAQVLQGQSSADSWMLSAHNYIKSEPGGSVYVPPEEANPNNVWRIFNGRLSYDKGAAILHMIRYELGDDDVFFDVLQTFQDQYRDSVATGLDFMGVLNDVSGMDFNYFFDQWYFGEGYPIFDVVWNQSPETLYIHLSQSGSAPAVTPFFETNVDIRVFYTDNSQEVMTVRQTQPDQYFELPIQGDIVFMDLDPDKWLIKEVNSIMVGISDENNPVRFSVSPNPTRDFVNIKFSESSSVNRMITVTDLSGRILIQEEIASVQASLDLSRLNRGVYLVKATEGSQSLVQRIIKQ